MAFNRKCINGLGNTLRMPPSIELRLQVERKHTHTNNNNNKQESWGKRKKTSQGKGRCCNLLYSFFSLLSTASGKLLRLRCWETLLLTNKQTKPQWNKHNEKPLKTPVYQLCTPSDNILSHRKLFFNQEGLFFLPSHTSSSWIPHGTTSFPHLASRQRADYKSHPPQEAWPVKHRRR